MIENKYHRWYSAIVAQGDDTAGYVEKHHILPRSLGGTNKKSNLIRVAARKHFLLHWLLTKFTEGLGYRKMLHAFGMMSTYKKFRCFSSWQYERMRLSKSLAQKVSLDEVSRDNLSIKMKLYYEDPEAHKKASERTSNYFQNNPEAGNQHSEKLINYYKDHPEARDARRIGTIESFKDPDLRQGARERTSNYWRLHPELLEQRGKKTRNYFSDPVNRKNHSEATKKGMLRKKEGSER